MIGPLANAMRLQALRVLALKTVSLIGSVESYDPNRYAAKVTLQPDGILTGWLPIAAQWIGSQWGLYTPPNIGDLCAVEFIDGDLSAGIIVGKFWNNDQQPLAVPSGECWIVHANGQSVKLLNSGALTLDDANGASVSLDGSGNIISQGKWSHTGDMNVDGTIDATNDVTSNGISLVNHVHGGVSSGSSTTAPPQ